MKTIAGVGNRTSGPGGLHNIGNLIALFGGFTVFYLSKETTTNDTSILWTYLFGSIETSCLTLSMLIFIAGGEAYHQGCGNVEKRNPGLIRLGDFLSGVATIVLAIALVQIGESRLAFIAGCLLAVSKFGTVIFHERSDGSGIASVVSRILRAMAIISRVPSLAAVSSTIIIHAIRGGDLTDTMLAMVMLVSYLLWLSGDCLLMTSSKS